MQFALAGVIMSATKFNHALVGLDEESVALVASVLSGFSYGRLKDQFIRRLSVSERAKLNHLLMDLTLDDRIPGQLSGDKVGSEFLNPSCFSNCQKDAGHTSVCRRRFLSGVGYNCGQNPRDARTPRGPGGVA